MIPLSECRVLEINSGYQGVSPEYLMEESGRVLADAILEKAGEGNRIGLICGTESTAGKAYVAARYLVEANEVEVLQAIPEERIASDLIMKNFERVRELTRPLEGEDLSRFDVIVDALCGKDVEIDPGVYRELVRRINSFPGRVFSVDVPSGMGSEEAVRPSFTVTFHDVKEGMTPGNSGEIIVKDIGIPPAAQRFVGPGEFIHYPLPHDESYRGDNGKVLLVGGTCYLGATALTGLSAYRIGVDLVHVTAPEPSYHVLASISPDLIVHRLGGDDLSPEDVREIGELSQHVDAVLVGMGLGRSAQAHQTALEIVDSCTRPIVINGDGIDLSGPGPLEGKRGVLILHHSQFRRVSGHPLKEDRERSVAEFASALGMTVLLKGKVDIISDGERNRLNRTGNPSMSVAGTDFTLAGILVGLLAKGVDPFNAARMASFINGQAGDLAFDHTGYGMVASDLVKCIPKALMDNLRKVSGK
ncbi:MAG: NAD(P)H-hydrate dehydratase [Methanomassiliicoccales archaeon]